MGKDPRRLVEARFVIKKQAQKNIEFYKEYNK